MLQESSFVPTLTKIDACGPTQDFQSFYGPVKSVLNKILTTNE